MDSSNTSRGELRADARRNRERILEAACELFFERGADVALDEVASRAGVGIGTLYRRFPDRPALNRAVVIHLLTAVEKILERVHREEQDPAQALAAYMHAALDLRVSAIVPMVLDDVSMGDEEIGPLRDRGASQIEQLVARAQSAGQIRPDINFGDIALLLSRLSRPLPGPISRELETTLAHRHLEIVMDGLRLSPGHSPLTGPELTRSDLRALPGDND